MTPDGRVVDDANGNVSHSEGQGFGMLLAAAVGDKDTFAHLWTWTERELYRRPDGLASWRWVPDAVPHVTDPNNATDGDLLIAWALLRAANRWNNPDHRAASPWRWAGMRPSRAGSASLSNPLRAGSAPPTDRTAR